MKKTLENVLKKYFGYKSFRPGQLEIISAVLAGKDTLAILPTGGGKSLCYQVPALVFKGLTVVVSPLIALMQDQVAQLDALGIPSLFLNSSLEWEEYTANMDRIRKGEIKLLYVAPETLVTERVQSLLQEVEVSCFTIDEAHCISEWGHDFRPEYCQLYDIRIRYPKAVCLALTATATQRVRSDIQTTLGMGRGREYFEYVASFNRPNIFIDVQPKSGSGSGRKLGKAKLNRADELVLDFIDDHKGESGIVYCLSRRQVDETTTLLKAAGIAVLPYHAGLADDVRARNQTAFVHDDVAVIVATVAFGMGINKPNVRWIIHYDLPKSVEQYYQEIGRAGRDGEPAHALLLFSAGDAGKIRFFFRDKDSDELAIAEKQLQSMLNLAQTRQCRRSVLLGHFGEVYPSSDGKGAVEADCCCDICLQGGGANAVAVDVTIPAQKVMSAVVRTGERYGAAYVVDVLLGSRMKRIIDNGHHKLSVYGIGSEYAKEDWMEIVRLLIEAGFLRKSEDYQVLSITRDGMDTLKERGLVMLPFVPSGRTGVGYASEQEKRLKKGSGKSLFAGAERLSADDTVGQQIAVELKKVRKRLAEDAGVPPYVIFGDKTVEDIAVKKPRQMTELSGIYGIGDVKAEKFGSYILRVVNDHVS